ncbi:MAG: O-antigen ligase family protein [Parvibaculum sp.]
MALAQSPQSPYRLLSQASHLSRTDKWVCLILGVTCATMFVDVQYFVGGARIRLFDLVFASFILIYGLAVLASGRLKRMPGIDFVAAYGVLTVYWVVNAAFLTGVSIAIKETVQAISFVAFFWILTDLLADERRFRVFFITFFCGIWALSLGNAAAFIASGDIYGFKQGAGAMKLTHSYSLVLSVLVGAFWLRKKSYLVLMLIIVAAALTIMSGERKAWLGAIAALVVGPAVADAGRLASGQLIKRILLVAAIALPFVFIAETTTEKTYLTKQVSSTFSAIDKFFNPAYDPTTDFEETISNRARIYVTQRANEVVADNPVFGMGVNKFDSYIDQISVGLPGWMAGGIHNEYLRIAAETGFVGLFLYAALLLVLARRVAICIRSMPYLDDHLKFRVRAGLALLAYGIVMNAFRASSGLTVLVIFLPAAFLYFQAVVIRFPNGKLRLASPAIVARGEDSEPELANTASRS